MDDARIVEVLSVEFV